MTTGVRLLTMALPSVLAASPFAAAELPALLTPEEIVALDRAERTGQPGPGLVKLPPIVRTRGDDGPGIRLIQPKSGAKVDRERLQVELRFEKRIAPVDLTSFQVHYISLFNISIDVTARMLAYQGTKLTEEGLSTPPFSAPAAGQMRFRVTLADTAKNRSEEEFTVVLK